jgi:hypothetical protein
MRQILNPVYTGARLVPQLSEDMRRNVLSHIANTQAAGLQASQSNPPSHRVTRAAFRGSPTGRRSTRNFEPGVQAQPVLSGAGKSNLNIDQASICSQVA